MRRQSLGNGTVLLKAVVEAGGCPWILLDSRPFGNGGALYQHFSGTIFAEGTCGDGKTTDVETPGTGSQGVS